MAAPLIQANNISLAKKGRTLLSSINLSIYKGQIVTIIGPNGAGKTTLIRILLGLVKPTSGSVSRNHALTIGYMPQRIRLNQQMPLTVHRFLTLGNKVSDDAIKQALGRVNMGGMSNASMHTLSGGENQRVLLARALLRKPDILVLDEPVQGVDINGQSALYQLISQLRDELNCAVLMVSHDLHIVMASTDEVICLNQHICCHGHPESVSNHPAYLALFGDSANSSSVAVYTHHHDHTHDIHGSVINDNKH